MSFDHKMLRGRKHLQGVGACALALVLAAGAAFQAAAASQDVLTAKPALRYDPKDRCPELRVSDEGDPVVVQFMVDAYGSPSQARVRAPSGVAGLDGAAVSCVMKIKFQPATRPGDAQPVDTWQQLPLRYATPAPAAAARAPAAGAAAAPPAVAPATATAAVPAGVATAGSHPGGGTSAVHVCADAAGKVTQAPVVTHSSGDPALDAAALRIATSGSANYHPAGTPGLSGCAQLNVTFESR
jgi:TonB family protein